MQVEQRSSAIQNLTSAICYAPNRRPRRNRPRRPVPACRLSRRLPHRNGLRSRRQRSRCRSCSSYLRRQRQTRNQPAHRARSIHRYGAVTGCELARKRRPPGPPILARFADAGAPKADARKAARKSARNSSDRHRGLAHCRSPHARASDRACPNPRRRRSARRTQREPLRRTFSDHRRTRPPQLGQRRRFHTRRRTLSGRHRVHRALASRTQADPVSSRRNFADRTGSDRRASRLCAGSSSRSASNRTPSRARPAPAPLQPAHHVIFSD